MEEAPPGSVVMALRASAASSNPQVSSSRGAEEAAPAPAALLAPPAPAATAVTAAPVGTGRRQRFSVELKPGETTIVSWKKLLRDASKGDVSVAAAGSATPAGAHPALESRIAPTASADQPMECEPKDGQPPSNRYSAVIEKIERLYMGKESSDEEHDDVPDDDQYDTEDSFIDDAELNDYFKVDKSSTKHQGFFVNRGKLERIEPNSSPNLAPKKRRRKDTLNPTSENDVEHVPSDIVNMGNVKMKAAARNAPLISKKSLNPSNIAANYVEHYQEKIHLKNKSSMDTGIVKKKPESSVIENSASLKMPSRELVHLMDIDHHKSGVIQSRESNKIKVTGETCDGVHEANRDKGVSSKEENDLDSSTKHRVREKNGAVELPDLNIPGNMYPTQTMGEATRVKETTGVRPKGTTLERAIRDLEKTVAECRPPKVDIQDPDSSQGVKKRLPLEVKQKLAKVARLADSQGKITSEQFNDRLMGILGHLVQPKTLKRHLKEMVEIGLSAKQAKADKFQQIKKEVIEMIKTRVTAPKSRVAEQQTVSSDDYQDPPKAKFNMDSAIEEKICDLYDLYVEGMDENKGPQARKLYVELAELWPVGYMDNLGIKDAINRARERKMALNKQHKVPDEERMKRKRLSATARMEDPARQSHQARAGQDRLSDAAFSLNAFNHHNGAKHHEKFRGGNSTSIATDEASKAIITMMKKKIKRKSEMELGSVHAHPKKHAPLLGKDKDKSLKHDVNSSDNHLYKSSLLTPSIPASEQPS